LELLAFNAQKFRGNVTNVTLAMLLFRTFLRGHVQTVPGNMHDIVKFEVRSFSCFGAISITVPCAQRDMYIERKHNLRHINKRYHDVCLFFTRPIM